MSVNIATGAAPSSSSSARPKVNLRSTAVKRIMQEANELSDPSEQDFVAAPLETDIFEWHCTMRGVVDSEFEGGLYHLRILLPPSYPMSAPDIILLTPNGRFELGKKICIDGLTSFHAGSWQPAWGVRTAILGLRSFWMQGGEALSAIGALDTSKEERKRLAKLSRDWVCPTCACPNHGLLPDASTSHPADVIRTVSVPISVPIGSAGSAETPADVREPAGLESVLVQAAAAILPLDPGRLDLSAPISSDLSPSGELRTSSPPTLPPPSSSDPPLPPPFTAQDTVSSHSPIQTIPRPSPIPVPEPPFAPPLSLPAVPPLTQTRRGVPIWLDALICACFSMLVLMVARKAIVGGGRDEGSLLLRDDL